MCGSVWCHRGYCWQYYEQQLDLLIPEIERLGALVPFKALDRDLPVYKKKAGWITWVLGSYRALPPHKKKKIVEPRQLLAVLQGWNVTEAEIKAQIQRTKDAGAGGYLLSLIEIDQSWEPKIIKH